MTQNQKNFQAAKIGSAFQKVLAKFDQVLERGNQPEFTAIRKKFRQVLKEYREQNTISVAFVGQYSSGKSTIISALTGQRDIKIAADIATDTTGTYNWSGIQVIDTPGLFTERKDHDNITYQAIDKADLLVFCLSYMLFDSITVENFKKLAYEKGYAWKMMLVINKMSDEAGEDDQKVANYRHSLTAALKPHSLDDFPVCFIDAKDYCEGVDEEDDFLIEISRFPTFIDALNQFVDQRAVLAKFDTPIRIALSCVEEAQSSCTSDSKADSTFLAILNRLSCTVRKERSRVRTKVRKIASNLSSAISKEAHPIASAVGTDENFEALQKRAEQNIQDYYEKAEAELQDVINDAAAEIRDEIGQIFQGDLVKFFVAYLEKNQQVSPQDMFQEIDQNQAIDQLRYLADIGQEAGVKITNFATRSGVQKTSQQVFLKSMDVAGSQLHQAVLNVGQFVGFKFKPWQAVGIAKNLGNFAKFLGPAVGVVSLGLDALEIHQENERQEEMANIRQKINHDFQAIGKDLEKQIEGQLNEFERQVYDEIDQKISEARRSEEETIAASNDLMKELMVVRENFNVLLQYIKKMTRTAAV